MEGPTNELNSTVLNINLNSFVKLLVWAFMCYPHGQAKCLVRFYGQASQIITNCQAQLYMTPQTWSVYL